MQCSDDDIVCAGKALLREGKEGGSGAGSDGFIVQRIRDRLGAE